jgi:beta-RFAP synthase
VRQFGGVGLMVDKPGLAVQIEAAKEWSSTGPLAGRALEFAKRFVGSLPVAAQRPFRIQVEHAPPEHIGLGVGTQLALSVAKAIAVQLGFADWPATELARRIGRGERSAIGVHGFDHGGLIVEGGKLPGEALSPLVGRFEFPAEWSVLLVTPEVGSSWHGVRERLAMAQLGPTFRETEQLCRIVLTGILPALASKDIDAFGDALYEFNARVGDLFAPVQGGRYASPAVAECVAQLRGLGIKGVGQSSWGPTVFAVVQPESSGLAVHEFPKAQTLVARACIGALVLGPI